jgi:hypothetical protein
MISHWQLFSKISRFWFYFKVLGFADFCSTAHSIAPWMVSSVSFFMLRFKILVLYVAHCIPLVPSGCGGCYEQNGWHH